MVRQQRADEAVRLARGENLVRERARRGLTLDALGRKLEISAEGVRKYQDGRTLLGPTACWRFAKALDCPFDRLFLTEAPAEGVAESPAVFVYDDADEPMLEEVLAQAQARLTGLRRKDLREILLDILEREDRGAP